MVAFVTVNAISNNIFNTNAVKNMDGSESSCWRSGSV